MCKIRVAICDDAVYICKGYGMQINSCEDMECVGTAYDSAQCIEMTGEQKPDVLLLDIQMEDEKSGIELIPKIKELSPDTVVIMLTSYEEDEYIFLSLLNGASGYVVKSTDGDEVLKKIREEFSKYKSGKTSDAVIEAFKREAKQIYSSHKSLLYMLDYIIKLSPKEYSTLRDIYMGLSYKQIAEKNVVEECTVRTCVSKILKKLNCKSMRELIANLKELKIFESNI